MQASIDIASLAHLSGGHMRVAASTTGACKRFFASRIADLVSEGEIDLATRSWNGKLFEKV
jgi:hypothetical protein